MTIGMAEAVPATPCITRGGALVETHELKRAFCGVEKLHLQGVHRRASCSQFSNAQLSKLAGNSFAACATAFCILILFFVFQVPTCLHDILANQTHQLFV